MDIKFSMAEFGFGHRRTNHIVIDSKGELWLTMAPTAVGGFLPMGMTAQPGTLRLEPIENGEAASFTYTATEAELNLTTTAGAKLRCVIDTSVNALRINGSGAFRLNGVEPTPRATSIKSDEGVYLNIGAHCYFITAKKGTISFDDTFELAKFSSVAPVIDVAPENDEFELLVYDLPADTAAPAATKTFDEIAAENSADFNEFAAGLVTLPQEWDDVRIKIAYLLWLCRRVINGNEVTVKNKYNSAATGANPMAIASMAFTDAKRAVDMLLAYPVELPPIAGVAAARLLTDNMLNDSRGEMYRVYSALEKITRYCQQERTMDGDGLSYYAYRFESGTASPEFFKAGEPVLAPDLNTYLIIASEVIGRLARFEYDDGIAQKWEKHARELTIRLIAELWNGEDFVGKNAYTEKLSPPDAKLSLVPILLGGKLPQEIIKKLAAKIDSETFAGAPMLLLLGGLYDAGETEKATALVTEQLEKARQNGIDCPFYGAELLAMAHKIL